jgi:CrcB protein
MQVGLLSDAFPRLLRTSVAIGFLGAFTTFSTFSYETMQYFEKGAWQYAFGNILANICLCLLAVGIGLILGRLVVGS